VLEAQVTVELEGGTKVRFKELEEMIIVIPNDKGDVNSWLEAQEFLKNVCILEQHTQRISSPEIEDITQEDQPLNVISELIKERREPLFVALRDP
jgi:hypothetical protein